MAALRFSILSVLFLCSCANSQPQENIEIDSLVNDCFVFNMIAVDTTKEPVIATGKITIQPTNVDCPCKSALMKYTATQEKNGNSFKLLSGQFTILGKETITLPIAVQKQLIFKETPINLAFSCSDN